MTAAELGAAYIGQEGTYAVGSHGAGVMAVRVAVKDARSAFGRTDLLIYPLAGSGETWVKHDSVVLDKPAGKGWKKSS